MLAFARRPCEQMSRGRRAAKRSWTTATAGPDACASDPRCMFTRLESMALGFLKFPFERKIRQFLAHALFMKATLAKNLSLAKSPGSALLPTFFGRVPLLK